MSHYNCHLHTFLYSHNYFNNYKILQIGLSLTCFFYSAGIHILGKIDSSSLSLLCLEPSCILHCCHKTLMGNWEFFFFKAFVCLYMSVNFTIKKTKQNKTKNKTVNLVTTTLLSWENNKRYLMSFFFWHILSLDM